jgi:pyrophosphatase PpaX
MPLSCLLIDHDDTLMSTFELRASMTALAVQEVFGKTIDGAAFLAESHGARLEEMGGAFTKDEGRIEEFVARYRALYYSRNTEGFRMFDGIREVLEELHGAGVPIGVVTSKLGRGAEAELAAANMTHLTPIVIGAEDVTYPKPNPEPLLIALEKLGHSTTDVLMVGDTSADILAARAAGVKSGAALWGAQEVDGLLVHNPDYQFHHPKEILALF